ncbi:hypothetical protein H6P81_013866 [Aristolochia fimbriata]|uniref:riboflavin kinase n=1 Tax=Aristolochia fimbriata TaxID=158543 RepID=A0AAV7EKJ5_ARIFI|nr:hypothetical protein H6P81_013866 [Aristolochia fimbriata]
MAKKTEGAAKKKKPNKKKLLSAQNAMAMKTKPAAENPFETIWSRRKFDILGKKRKGEERRIGLARSHAVEKRKKTLLKEYEQTGKSSVFVDKRIGEKNDDLEEFDKAILRFQRERQSKLNKKAKYNLSDGEEDDFTSLSKKDDFEDEVWPDDEDDETDTSGKSRKGQSDDVHLRAKTDLPKGEENKHKSKKEVMQEIISKSKFYKGQRAKDKEEDEHLMEQLDKDFSSLAQSEALLSLTQPNKLNALNALLNMGSTKASTKGASSFAHGESSKQQDKPDAYDCLVKEMMLDLRARPSDRTKTPEEIAQEERERLEQLEEERQKRMLGDDDMSDEGSDGNEESNVLQKMVKSISGDDLGDSFSIDDEKPNRKGWVDEILERKEHDPRNRNGSSDEDSECGEDHDDQAKGSDEDEDQTEGNDEDEDQAEGSDEDEDEGDADDEDGGLSEKVLSVKDWEQSDDDDLGTDLEDDEEDVVEEKTMKKHKDKNALNLEKGKVDPRKDQKKKSVIRQASLPFVIEAPQNLEELLALLENRSASEVAEAITRIRACNAVRLAAENRKKMQVFYGVLLQYYATVARTKPLNLNLINLLVNPLIEMSVDTPYFAAICARQRILRIRSQFCEDIKNPEKSSWPSLKTLLLLRLWAMTFPCSDFRHVVMTPAILLICEYLMRCPLVLGRDIVTGSFLCSMLLMVTKQSRKFCPEAIIFLNSLLASASATGQMLSESSQWHYLMDIKTLKPWLHIRGSVSEIHPLDFLAIMDMPDDSPFFNSDNFRASVLLTVLETLRGFVRVCEGFSSFPEIFLPVSAQLRELARSVPDMLQVQMNEVAQLIEDKIGEVHMLRQPLQMRKQKPVLIKLLNPKFEENFVKGRDYDPDRERAERKKLKKLLKGEAKGAARELRKDNAFLFEAKERDRQLLEAERAERYGKARAFLQEQEHAFNSRPYIQATCWIFAAAAAEKTGGDGASELLFCLPKQGQMTASVPLKRFVSHVILDLDGTLLHTDGVVVEVLKTYLARYGKQWDGRAAHKIVGTMPLEAANAIVEDYELSCSTEEFLSELMPLFSDRWRNIKALPGATRLINHLRGHDVPIALASNSPRENIETKISHHHGWKESFSVIIGGDEVTAGKPSPEMFLEAAKRLNAEPSKCLVIEDSLPGITAGKAAGMGVIAVPSIRKQKEAYSSANEIANSLLDLKLENWGLPPFQDWIESTLPIEPWYIGGPVIKGFGRGSKELGIPTANLSVEGFPDLLAEQASGVYFGWAGLPTRGIYKMVMSIGWNPYYDNAQKTIEPWLLHEFEDDFYGEDLRLAIVGYIRPEANFPTLESLIARIQEDRKIAEKALDLQAYAKYQDHPYLRSSLGHS